MKKTTPKFCSWDRCGDLERSIKLKKNCRKCKECIYNSNNNIIEPERSK